MQNRVTIVEPRTGSDVSEQKGRTVVNETLLKCRLFKVEHTGSVTCPSALSDSKKL